MKPIQVLNKMLEARDCLHLIHWNTTSYAEHKALGKFYDGWLDLVDSFIETYQGRYQRIGGDLKIEVSSDYVATEYLTELRRFIQMDAPTIIAPTLDADLSNILADMLGLVNHTLYMLTLK
jgi:hypothetical protein